jgi:hypothetical protein
MVYVNTIRPNIIVIVNSLSEIYNTVERISQMESEFLRIPGHEYYGDVEVNIMRLKGR